MEGGNSCGRLTLAAGKLGLKENNILVMISTKSIIGENFRECQE